MAHFTKFTLYLVINMLEVCPELVCVYKGIAVGVRDGVVGVETPESLESSRKSDSLLPCHTPIIFHEIYI